MVVAVAAIAARVAALEEQAEVPAVATVAETVLGQEVSLDSEKDLDGL
jgi:hypothetical protein